MPKVKIRTSMAKSGRRKIATKKGTKVSKGPKVRKVRKVTKIRATKLEGSEGKELKTATGRSKLTAEVHDISGRKKGTQVLPKEFFGAKVNEKLLAQALHVYFTNQTAHYASVKTRAEARGGGAKPWRQKGTGRARAGSNRSPIWVGGGIAHGPKSRKVQLTLPKKMKRQALISALSSKAQEGGIKIISNIEKIEPKTKIVANFLKKTGTKGSTLFVISKKNENFKLASRNLSEAFCDIVSNLNAFEIIENRNIFFSQEAIGSLSGSRQYG